MAIETLEDVAQVKTAEIMVGLILDGQPGTDFLMPKVRIKQLLKISSIAAQEVYDLKQEIKRLKGE